jgi:hypothetical protein
MEWTTPILFATPMDARWEIVPHHHTAIASPWSPERRWLGIYKRVKGLSSAQISSCSSIQSSRLCTLQEPLSLSLSLSLSLAPSLPPSPLLLWSVDHDCPLHTHCWQSGNAEMQCSSGVAQSLLSCCFGGNACHFLPPTFVLKPFFFQTF